MKISRKELLLLERAKILRMSALSFDLMLKCRDYYDREIERINNGANNPTYNIDEKELKR